MKKILSIFAIGTIALGILGFLNLKWAEAGKPQPPFTTKQVIIIDPGHGGTDPGAVNTASGLKEKELNLQIAQSLQNILKSQGYNDVYLTREDNTTTLDNNARYTKANQLGGTLLVSIHLNSSTDTSINGSQTFYGKQIKDLVFAKLMQASLVGTLGLKDRGVAQFASGVLLKSNMPSVITESVFMSNPTEAQALVAGTRQAEIAQAIASGINSWYGK